MAQITRFFSVIFFASETAIADFLINIKSVSELIFYSEKLGLAGAVVAMPDSLGQDER